MRKDSESGLESIHSTASRDGLRPETAPAIRPVTSPSRAPVRNLGVLSQTLNSACDKTPEIWAGCHGHAISWPWSESIIQHLVFMLR